jgi:hypothetical protein
MFASAPIIGMASAENGVTLDNAKVSGTATIFDGSTLQADGFSRIHLTNGTRLDFAAGAKAQLYATHETLSAGMTEVQSPSGFEIDTNLLRIKPESADSITRVKIDGGKVYVTALNSPVSVSNSQGLLVAKVAPGMPMAFMAQGASAPNTFKASGCVVNKGGVALVSDDTTKAVSQLVGANLKNVIGSSAEIVGTVDATATPAAGASQVVKVTSAVIKKKGGCSAVASTLGASTAAAGLGAAASSGAAAGAGAAAAGAGGAAAGAGAAAAGAAAGVGIGTTAAVVGGVAAAAAASVGGAAAAGAFTTPSP